MASIAWMKAAACWCVILVLAVMNGAVREKALIPALGSVGGLVASALGLCACIVVVALLTVPWYGPLAPHQWLFVGVFWLLLTLSFEFAFGRIAQHKTWGELFEAYKFRGGNLWPLVLIVTVISPWLAARIRS
jgi:hypothetical protein